MEHNAVERPARGRALGVAFVAGAIGLAGLAWIANDVWHRAQVMQLAAKPAAAVLTAPAGAAVEAVVRLRKQQSAGVYTAELLDRIDDANYRATGSVVQLTLARDTSVVMGSAEDIRLAAIVQFKGVAEGGHSARVRRVVILTKFVDVVEK
jgi:hypothetical protein